MPLNLNLNTACESDLMTLPSVDLELARAIVQRRRDLGYFQRIEDLHAVAGVTEPILASLGSMLI